MKRLLNTAVLIVLILVAGAEALHAQQTRVLFIGNSFTYYNNLPEMFAGLAKSARTPRIVDFRMIAPGGVTLEEHWKKGDALAAIQREKWDWVILQEQSQLGVELINSQPIINDPRNFHEYARLFDAAIKTSGAKPIFLHTWSRRPAPHQQKFLDYAYMSIAKELGTPIIPVGIAWAKVRTEKPSLDLYASDGSHPGPAGSYLAACLIYAALFGETPKGLTGEIIGHPVVRGRPVSDVMAPLVSLVEKDANWIQETAWQTFKKVQADGGYVKVNPAIDSLPTPALPTSRQMMRESDLVGTWTGPLRLYSDKATLELRIRKQGGAWTATAIVEIERPEGTNRYMYPATDFSVESAEIQFTIVNPTGTGIDEKHRAVFTGKSLAGVAEFGSPADPPYLVGSWELVHN